MTGPAAERHLHCGFVEAAEGREGAGRGTGQAAGQGAGRPCRGGSLRRGRLGRRAVPHLDGFALACGGGAARFLGIRRCWDFLSVNGIRVLVRVIRMNAHARTNAPTHAHRHQLTKLRKHM